jgi:Uma2 family endonuclease
MGSVANSLVTWTDFLRLPERPDTGQRYELHDGEVVVMPPARPIHIKLQKRIERLLEALAGDRGVVVVEFPYRPVVNLQYWFADVAYLSKADWDSLPANEYPIFAPSLIVEVLSPSNVPQKVERQRIVAMSAGTQEFWIVNGDARTIEVTNPTGTKKYSSGDVVRIDFLAGSIRVDDLFAI